MASYDQGVYLCRITAQGFDESKEKKTPFFWLEFQPQGRVDPDHPDGSLFGCDDYLRTVNMYMTDKTIDRVKEKLKSLGWEGSRFQDLEPNGAHSFVNLEVRLQCVHEQTGDKVYDKWDFPYEGGSQVKHEPGLARRLDALYGRAGGQKPTTKPPATRPAVQPPAERTESVAASNATDAIDDIPFTWLIGFITALTFYGVC